jgi:hypothetical protein
VQFRYTKSDNSHELRAYRQPESGEKLHKFEEKAGGKYLGSISWHAKTGRVSWIRTSEGYTGLGVATTLWNKANKLASDTGIKKPEHSIHRTAEGDKWAKSLGKSVPDLGCWQCGKRHDPKKFNHDFYAPEMGYNK